MMVPSMGTATVALMDFKRVFVTELGATAVTNYHHRFFGIFKYKAMYHCTSCSAYQVALVHPIAYNRHWRLDGSEVTYSLSKLDEGVYSTILKASTRSQWFNTEKLNDLIKFKLGGHDGPTAMYYFNHCISKIEPDKFDFLFIDIYGSHKG